MTKLTREEKHRISGLQVRIDRLKARVLQVRLERAQADLRRRVPPRPPEGQRR